MNSISELISVLTSFIRTYLFELSKS